MKHHHITIKADEAKSKVDVWNESGTIELTMSVREVIELEQRFFMRIDATIPDETMGFLLSHFRDEGTLLNKEDMSRV